MKTRLDRLVRSIVLGLAFAAASVSIPSPSFAQAQTQNQIQASGDFFTVSGTVRDRQSGRPVSNVSVSVPETRIGTVTNADGTFSIKIRYDMERRELEFSHLGYRLQRLPVEGKDRTGLTIDLEQEAIVLTDVVVVDHEARALVEEAMRRIGSNYSDRATLLTGFYRETAQKRSNYINISEAVVEIYGTPYTEGVRGERLRIVKGRQLVSPRTSDTLGVKLQGGPNTYFYCDIVKNRELVLDPEILDHYRFRLESPAVIDERPHYCIAFEPQMSFSDRALFVGRLYIDRESFTISRAEYAFDMRDRDKVTGMILRRKPLSLRFNPDEVSYVLGYRQRDGRSYLYYIGVRLRFRCDWRRRLFATNYSILSEMVITDGRDEGVAPPSFRQSFREDQSLSDRVGDFYDAGFWEAYNIIEPTESLESAVDRLKRRIE
uniref:Carboxypeptidase-like regulatory domain-containing protein n=1 Tax=termite gut metagenome TaxID=433724 RepID=S0DFM6_9ZZZZ